MPSTVFYAWQSLSPKTNRNFIETALDKALKALRADIHIETVIDRNADGIPGIPDIPSSIYTKIENADAFVCDVSFVSSPDSGRPTPNPNVLIELGYAIHALGENRAIMVFNDTSGDIGQLPFDLDKRRVMAYHLQEDATTEQRAAQRDRLVSALKNDLKAMLITAHEARRRDNRVHLAWEVERNRGQLRLLDRTIREAMERDNIARGLSLETVPLVLEWHTDAWATAAIRLSAGLTAEEHEQLDTFYTSTGMLRQHIAYITKAQRDLESALRHYYSQPGGTLRESSPGSGAGRARSEFTMLVYNTLAPSVLREIAEALRIDNPLT